VPTTRTPRDLLLAALERRHLTGYRSSRELAWVVFPPLREGGSSLEVLHVPRLDCYRVMVTDTRAASTTPVVTLGEFQDSDAAAACVEDALASPASGADGR
jgi:hypothetical protein